MKPDQLASKHGQRTTRTVGVLRGASILFSGAVFACLGWGLSFSFAGRGLDAASPALWLLAGVSAPAAVAAVFCEIIHGTRHARAEERDLRARILRRFFSASLEGKQGMPPARAISLLTDSVERVTDYRQTYRGATVASVIAPLLLVLYITTLDWVAGLSILALIPLVPAAIWFFFTRFRKVSSNSRAQREKLSVAYLDALRQLTTIRLFGAGERIETALRAKGEENRRAVMKLLAANQLVIIVMDAVFLLLLICWSVFVLSWRAGSGALGTGEALSALFILPLLLEPLTQVAGFFYIGMGGRASARAISRLLAESAPVAHAPVSEMPDQSAAVSVRHLGHDFGRGAVLTNLSFDVPYGAKVAIIGSSGAGKSTLLSLLRGTLPVQDGAIAVAGRNFSEISAEQACLASASVSQKTWLFSGTIAENLRFAAPAASDAQLWEALEKAQLADEVRALSAGLETDLGEEGSRLSGGQAQRLSLARALLSRRRVLLLDEPTSHIDPDSEAKIISALAKTDATLIMVTHRHSLLAIADKIYELNQQGLVPITAQEVTRAE